VRVILSLLLAAVVFLGQALQQRAAADQPRAAGKIVADYWDAAYLPGGRAGYVHTSVRELERDGKKILRTTAELNLTVKRFRETAQLRMETGTDETPQGKVVGVFMRQYLGWGKSLTITGTVRGKQVVLVQDGKVPLKPAPWDERVLGLYRQQKLFQDRRVKPGDSFTYRAFEPSVNLVIRYTVTVKDYEEVPVAGGKRQKLLRVESRPDPIDKVQLPTVVYWLDAERMPARSQVEIPGLGQLTLYRTSRQAALAPGKVAELTDIGTRNYVRLRQRIVNPYGTRQMVYRITVKGDDNPASTFVQDERQQVKNVHGQTFDLYVRASRPPSDADGPAGKEPGEEFLQSSYFITSDDAKVKELARQAVGGETDPWRKALRIERWVHSHMHNRNDIALATAKEVARSLAGDCRQHAMLMAAMCRAEGIPSRTALGLIYADTGASGPAFVFHMWTEVWVRGRWVPLDATLGRGYVGATHLKITDDSWHDTRSMTPLLPILRVLGRLTIEVLGPEDR
jgi:hypothetical protein